MNKKEKKGAQEKDKEDKNKNNNIKNEKKSDSDSEKDKKEEMNEIHETNNIINENRKEIDNQVNGKNNSSDISIILKELGYDDSFISDLTLSHKEQKEITFDSAKISEIKSNSINYYSDEIIDENNKNKNSKDFYVEFDKCKI